MEQTLAVPKYRQIYEKLEVAIRSGVYSDGQRLPSESELVAEHKASRLTVARALKELQAEGLLVRRAGSGSYVSRPVQPKGYVFGLLIPDLGQTEIFEPICQGMMQAREASQHSLLWGYSKGKSDCQKGQAEQLCQHYIDQKVSGVFFAPLEWSETMNEVNERIAVALDAAGIPIILLDRCIYPYPRRSKYDLVGIDNRRGGHAVTRHLIDLGCRRIAFIARPFSASTVDARIAGYREALFEADLPADRELIQRIDAADSAAVRALLDSARPDAFVCANDHTAALLMRTLAGFSIRVPEDIGIAGIDDVKYANLLQIPLTTLRQPCNDLGAIALLAMLDRIGHPTLPTRDILLDCKLIVRRSCGSHLSGGRRVSSI